MSEPEVKIRIPKEGGLAEARQKLKDLKRKSPSPELVKIIEEVTDGENGTDQSEDIAARNHDRDAEV